MKKITVITGQARIGKTRKAKEMAEDYEENTVVFIPVANRPFFDHPFFLGGCTEQTKLLIFDDVRDIYSLGKLIDIVFAYPDKLRIEDKGKWPFYIELPEIIITCGEAITPEDIRLIDRGNIETIIITNSEICTCEMPVKIKGENKCWRCKKVLTV